MSTRRKFLKQGALGGAALGLGFAACNNSDASEEAASIGAQEPKPRFMEGLVLSTWDAGIVANESSWKTMQAGGSALDMAENGVKVIEADFKNLSVGLGGLPDREGHTTLDACIMDSNGNAGSVMFLEHIKHPVSVARKVMENTPHVQIVGEGAYLFAREMGFEHDDFKSEEAQKAWKEWLVSSEYKPIVNIENHDTIGLLSMDTKGDIAGSCTTSGLSYKIRGRVGDSPIIGAGLYVDNEIGAATSTGLGELVIKACGSFLIVELIRQGASPQEACEEAVNRIVKRNKNYNEVQVGFLAINVSGEIGAYAIQPGFTYALMKAGQNALHSASSFVPPEK